MDPERVRAIASAGGKAAHAKGVAHRWTSEEASAAGRKGGSSRRLEVCGPDGYADDEGPPTERAPFMTGDAA
jgi:general stress protein YciG